MLLVRIANMFKGTLSYLREFLETESLKILKMMKNAFYFTLEALFVLKLFIILSRLSVHVKSGLIRKIRLISKFMTSKPG